MNRYAEIAVALAVMVVGGCTRAVEHPAQPATTPSTSVPEVLPRATTSASGTAVVNRDPEAPDAVLAAGPVSGPVVRVDGGDLPAAMNTYLSAGGLLGPLWALDSFSVGVPRPDHGYIVQASTNAARAAVTFLIVDRRSPAELVEAFAPARVNGTSRTTAAGCVSFDFAGVAVSDCVTAGQHVLTVEQPATATPSAVRDELTAAGRHAGVDFGESWNYELRAATATVPSASQLRAEMTGVDHDRVTAVLTAAFGPPADTVWSSGAMTWTLTGDTLVYRREVTL